MRRAIPLMLILLLLTSPAQASFVFSNATPTPVPQEGMPTQAPEAAAQQQGDTSQGGMLSVEDVDPVQGETQQVASAAVEILITAAGDVTLGGNMRKNPSSNMYTKIVAANDNNLAYFFANVYDIFSQDDMTLVNFEGTLTTATSHKDNEFCFRAPPEHVQVLTLGSVEAVAFENNHVMDFHEQGYNDTIAMFEQYGIVYSTEAHIGVYEVKGVSIAMLAYQTFNNQYPRLLEEMPAAVAAAKAAYDIVIVSYHWGDEMDYAPNSNQITLGRATVDAGADLVLGHHSHRINPIEQYNGKYIVYSLGNCSFSGNTRPSDMDTFLFQQKFTVVGDTVVPGAFRIIPSSISSNSGKSGSQSMENDLAVTPFEAGSEAARRVINRMLEEGKKLEYAVTDYPTAWQ